MINIKIRENKNCKIDIAFPEKSDFAPEMNSMGNTLKVYGFNTVYNASQFLIGVEQKVYDNLLIQHNPENRKLFNAIFEANCFVNKTEAFFPYFVKFQNFVFSLRLDEKFTIDFNSKKDLLSYWNIEIKIENLSDEWDIKSLNNF
jgi:hypothetical protein